MTCVTLNGRSLTYQRPAITVTLQHLRKSLHLSTGLLPLSNAELNFHKLIILKTNLKACKTRPGKPVTYLIVPMYKVESTMHQCITLPKRVLKGTHAVHNPSYE